MTFARTSWNRKIAGRRRAFTTKISTPPINLLTHPNYYYSRQWWVTRLATARGGPALATETAAPECRPSASGGTGDLAQSVTGTLTRATRPSPIRQHAAPRDRLGHVSSSSRPSTPRATGDPSERANVVDADSATTVETTGKGNRN